jgi:hypothetical protein
MRSFSLLALCFGLLLGCSQRETLQALKVDVHADELVPLSQLTDKLETIPLETTEQSLLMEYIDVKISSDYVFVTDYKKVLEFDKKGKFIRKIGMEGKGPGEYKFPHTITFDEAKGVFYIVGMQKILLYTFGGEFITEFHIDQRMRSLHFHEGQLLSLQNLVDKSPEGDPLDVTQFIRMTDRLEGIDTVTIRSVNVGNVGSIPPPMTTLSFAGGMEYVYYPALRSPQLYPTLFAIKGDAAMPAENLNFGFEQRDEKNDMHLYDIIRTDHHLFCYYIYNNHEAKGRWFVYNYATREAHNVNKGFQDDFHQGGPVRIGFYDTEKGLCYFSLNGVDAAGKIDGVNENSNPVLFLFKLK